MIFAPVLNNIISLEISYFFSPKNAQVLSKNESRTPGKKNIVPKDEDFGIVIPKINANSKIVKDVDPFNSKEYQFALTKGVAHAKGTVYPGDVGNVFLFSHSSADFFEASRYNSIFYLLSKLEQGDEVYLFYKKKKIKYKVFDKKVVNGEEVSYLKKSQKKQQLTLMTCWPPGTTLKRLLIFAALDTQQ